MKTMEEIKAAMVIQCHTATGGELAKFEAIAFGVYAEVAAPHSLLDTQDGIDFIQDGLARAIFLKLNPRT